jgi:hypothetical protein
MNPASRTFVAASLTCMLLTGCRIDEHKNANGKSDNVDISTPFGSMHVKGNDAADTAAIGITAYPGAVPVKDDDGKGNDAADINLSFGDFHLGVKAASFQTSDQPDKVLAFYRKDLSKKFGDVIECKGDQTIGSPAKTSQGLTCADKDKNHVTAGAPDSKGVHIHGGNSSDDNLELRAGSQQHQHIVGVEAKNGGTKIGLVALDLPGHLGDHDSKDSE